MCLNDTFSHAMHGIAAVKKIIWQGSDSWATAHLEPVRDFTEAILQQRQPKTNLEQALLIQKIFDAIYTSAETGRAVEIK